MGQLEKRSGAHGVRIPDTVQALQGPDARLVFRCDSTEGIPALDPIGDLGALQRSILPAIQGSASLARWLVSPTCSSPVMTNVLAMVHRHRLHWADSRQVPDMSSTTTSNQTMTG